MKSQVKRLVGILAAAISAVGIMRRNKAPTSPDNRPVYDNPQPLEPWAMNYNRNLARSRLLRLPPELAPLIAQQLSPDGIYLLRQTSRHFRGIFPPVEQDERARSILRSQLYCSRCRELQGDQTELQKARKTLRQPLWCSGCREKHPAVYFGAQQRHLPEYARVCIGREGHMRICDHLTLYWSWLKDETEGPTEANFQCDDESHGDEPIEVGVTKLSILGGTTARIKVDASWKVFSCRQSPEESCPSANVLQGLHAYAGEHDMPLCPHATLGNRASQQWQIRVLPAIKRRRCYVDGRINQRTCNSKAPLVLKLGDTTTQPGNHCPACLMTTVYSASAISKNITCATHGDHCPDCKAQYVWGWYSHEYSNRRDNELELRMSRSGSFKKPTDDEWLNCLEVTGPVDPRGDPETKHLLWCDDSNCSTFRKWAEVRRWAVNWNRHDL